MRKLTGSIAALVLIGFGVMSLHYVAGDVEEYRNRVEWADRHSLPKPSFGIFVMGAACSVVGGVLLGFQLRSCGSRPV